jgi:predicted nucleotidyltransferase
MPARTVSIDEIIDETMKRVLAVARPTRVILFGSAARGEVGANSDLDILVVVPTGTHRRRTAQAIYRNMIGLGFAVDIVVVTEDDFNRFDDHDGMVIKPAIKEGRLLYAA